MTDLVYKKYQDIIIYESSTLVDALKKMDEVGKKLLIVVNNSREFISLLSVGDIQRSLIKNQNYTIQVREILRKKITFATESESRDKIKALMLERRAEFMPVLDKKNKLVTVLFWSDIFEEQFLSNRGKLNIPVVMIAGGKGTRLKPITNIIPKALIPIGDLTISEYIINKFVSCGVNQFYLSVHYKAEMIKKYFDELPDKQYDIQYFQEDKPSGTAGSLSLLKGKIKTSFFVSNCDIIINEDYEKVYSYHQENKNDLTIIGALKNYTIPYGALNVEEDGLLTEIVEKPENNVMINTGMYVLEPHLLDKVPENTFFHITELIQEILKEGGRVGVFPISEASWFDIGNWSEYNKTLKKVGETPII